MTPSFLAPAMRSSNGAALAPRGDVAIQTSPTDTKSRLIIFITAPPELEYYLSGESLLFSFRWFFKKLVSHGFSIEARIEVSYQLSSHRRCQAESDPEVEHRLKPRQIQLAVFG